jgi:hypothetical protein
MGSQAASCGRLPQMNMVESSGNDGEITLNFIWKGLAGTWDGEMVKTKKRIRMSRENLFISKEFISKTNMVEIYRK